MKFPRPWYRPARRLWYVTLHGKQHNLGPDEPQAFERYKELLGQRPEPAASRTAPVLGLIDKFLERCREHRAAKTYEWYRWRLQLFAKSIGRDISVAELKPFHLDDALAQHAEWSNGTKHGLCRAVQRAMFWAEKKGYIDRSPLTHYEKPRPGKRRLVISPDEFRTILALVPSPEFRDLLNVTWETAARPQETLIVEARHVDLINARWVFSIDQSKGDTFPRIVYLTESALAITRRLMLKHPHGPIFRNAEGNPWTPYAVNCAFVRVQFRLGQRRMRELKLAVPPLARPEPTKDASLCQAEHVAKQTHRDDVVRERRRQLRKLALSHGKKYCLYHLRHSWLDRALKSGVDVLTCAILMGHRDPSTLAKVYQHLSQSPEYLRGAARKATG
jgi:integrase